MDAGMDNMREDGARKCVTAALEMVERARSGTASAAAGPYAAFE